MFQPMTIDGLAVHPTGLEIQLPDGGTGEHVSSPFACGGTGCSKEPWQT